MDDTQLATIDQKAQPAAAFLAKQRNPAAVESDLRKLAKLLGYEHWQLVAWSDLTAAHVDAVFNKVVGAPATRNRALSTLKGVAQTAWRLNMLDSETLARIKDVKGDGGSREIAGRNIDQWEIVALMRACAKDRKREDSHTPAAIRDAAIIGLAVKTGARRDELANIMRSNITTTSEGYDISVIGKRNKERTLHVDSNAAVLLTAWLTLTSQLASDGPLFVTIKQTGVIGTKALSNMALHKMLAKRAKQAELPLLSWHDFRRTFAGTLLDVGEDISTVAKMMGHSSVITTARYDRRPTEARRKAARKISVPMF